MNTNVESKLTMRRYSPEQKEQAVRMVLALRVELGTSQGTVKRVAAVQGNALRHCANETRKHEPPAIRQAVFLGRFAIPTGTSSK